MPSRLSALRRDSVALGVAAVALLATAARLVELGARVFQYDEAWIGHWILRYAKDGVWRYDPILHGLFLVHVDRTVFEVAGVSDVTARLAVALLGGALPLAALCFRDRLRDEETVALAVLLAANPILLYYSRFMRFDVPLAVFALFAVGFAVRAADRSDPRYLHATAVALGLAFTTKENVLLYLLAWLGAGLLVLDADLLGRSAPAGARLGSLGRRIGRGVRRWRGHLALAVVEFLVVFGYFYAPRLAGAGRVGLWNVGAEPATLPDLLAETYVTPLSRAFDVWVAGGRQSHPYIPYAVDYVVTLAEGAPVVAVAGLLGFLLDRHVHESSRPVVSFAFLWGALSVVGYPLANLFPTPWSTVHAVVPLALPAAVGVGAVYREARRGRVAGDRVRVAGAALLLVVAGATTAATAASTSHLHPQDGDSELVYHNQAEGDVKPALQAAARAIRGNDGTDVLYVGPYYNISSERVADRFPAYGGWHRRLPLPWYFEGMDATVDSTARLRTEKRAPVVVTRARNRDVVGPRLGSDYRFVGAYNMTQGKRRAAFYVRASAVNGSHAVNRDVIRL